jgi:hypothetical protein
MKFGQTPSPSVAPGRSHRFQFPSLAKLAKATSWPVGLFTRSRRDRCHGKSAIQAAIQRSVGALAGGRIHNGLSRRSDRRRRDQLNQGKGVWGKLNQSRRESDFPGWGPHMSLRLPEAGRARLGGHCQSYQSQLTIWDLIVSHTTHPRERDQLVRSAPSMSTLEVIGPQASCQGERGWHEENTWRGCDGCRGFAALDTFLVRQERTIAFAHRRQAPLERAKKSGGSSSAGSADSVHGDNPRSQ